MSAIIPDSEFFSFPVSKSDNGMFNAWAMLIKTGRESLVFPVSI